MGKTPLTEAAAFIESGNTALAKGDLDFAIADYSKAILLDPNLITAYNRRAEAYIKRDGKCEQHQDYLRKPQNRRLNLLPQTC